MKYFLINNTCKRALTLVVFYAVSISLTSCNDDEKQSISSPDWQLVWSDDFEGPAGQLPDASKWGYDLGNNNGWGNQELENYTNNPENVSLDGDGNLVITAIKNGNSYTSARIKTQNKFSQAYGRFEARLKTPYGPGIWPA
nr:glycoside hydrolase family 16 protein [Flavobacterium sp.]